ncbi:integrase catalytic domain-containing protein [Trichonephila clavipes]|nr:integrase catalytic domain-containing protein [Trichonephila clavipes]
MSVIVNESNISKQLSEFWDLENLGIEAEVSDEENIDNDIMSEFEAGISYQNKRYKVKFPWKPNMKTLLENNEEIARERFLKLRSRFKNDSSLFEDYKLVVNNYLSEKILERVPFEEENLKYNIFYLPHRAVIRTDKWCNEIHYLSEIKIPRYYFQNFLPSNATTIQLHCFSDASKKAYGTVAYLRIELKDGNIISSFVASKGRVAPLKTLSIPRLELMGALLSARLSDKIATALILPVSRFYWTDSSITCYWIKGDFNKYKVFVKNRIKEIQKLSDPKEWRYCKGKDNPADLISRVLPLNDLKNNKIWWHGPKWLTMNKGDQCYDHRWFSSSIKQ